MVTPLESRAALKLLTDQAVGTSSAILSRLGGAPEVRRLALLEAVPSLISYYAEGSAALAADFYESERDLAGVARGFTPELVLVDRTVKIRRAIAWSADPLFSTGTDLALSAGVLAASKRLAEVVQIEVARGFRDTITTNRQNDPQSIGWRRVARADGCGFCRMLADRGAVYRESSARFASHTNCGCGVQPVFVSADPGPEASVQQYKASARSRTPAQREALRNYIAEFFPG